MRTEQEIRAASKGVTTDNWRRALEWALEPSEEINEKSLKCINELKVKVDVLMANLNMAETLALKQKTEIANLSNRLEGVMLAAIGDKCDG